MSAKHWQNILAADPEVQHIFTPFDEIMRRRWPPPAPTETGGAEARSIQVRVASSDGDLAWADQFVTQRYLWRGYRMSEQDGNAQESTVNKNDSVTLLASRDERPVGTITVGIDGRRGLLLAESNCQTVDLLRRVGRRVGEFIRLAVLDDVDASRVLYHLFRAAYELIRMVYEATDILIEVNPRHVGFYQKVFGFTVAASERICSRVSAPAVLLRLDLVGLDEELGTRLRSLALRAEPPVETVAA